MRQRPASGRPMVVKLLRSARHPVREVFRLEGGSLTEQLDQVLRADCLQAQGASSKRLWSNAGPVSAHNERDPVPVPKPRPRHTRGLAVRLQHRTPPLPTRLADASEFAQTFSPQRGLTLCNLQSSAPVPVAQPAQKGKPNPEFR